MGIATMEAIVKTVGAILKTLECPICLDTLKTPVSAGCGHFFCRECASGILLSNYRAPCPLCKRSFTRRSIQEAHQRQTVIAAATALSETCSNLTGVNILGNCAIESRKSFGAILPVSPKSLKATLNENQEVISKKRKSCENEDKTISSAINCAYKPDMKESKTENVKNNSAISDDECSSAKKRVCLDSDEECDLPSLEEIWSQMEPEPTDPECSTTKNVIAVKPLSIIPTDKISKLKTYSRYGKKTDNKLFTSESSGTDVEKLNIDKAFEDLLSAGTDENDIGNGSHLKKTAQSTVKLKNKINALKNKTNKVESDKLILQEDGFLSKSKDLKESKNKSEELAKENELHLTPRAASNISSAKRGRRKLSKSQSSIHKLRRRARSSLSTDEDIISKIKEATNHDLVVENTSNAGQQHNKVCFNVDEIAIAKSNHPNQTEGLSTDDTFKAIGLTDTAVTVDSVTSPLASKALSLHKSPGWSRVKKVKKDFKMRNFSSLQVEKNSPQVSLKNTASVVDSVVSVKEIVSSSKGTVEDKGLDSDHQNFENVSNMQNAKAKGSVHQTSEKEFSLSNLNKAKRLSDVRNEESCPLEDETDMNVDINNADGSEMNEKEFEKMDCTDSVVSSGAKHNISHVKENDYGVEPLNSDTKISLENPGSNVRTVINENQNISSINMNNNIASSSSFSPEKHDFLQMNEGNSGKFSVLENLGGLNRNSSINAAISERNDRRNESTISDQVSIYDNSTKHTNVFFGNDTPKLRKQKTLTVQAHISEYESLQPESLNTDKNLQYIEHSQQTSQVAFHYNNPNTLYNNLQLVAQQPPLFYTNFNAEKTKVVKRTCLTLEEVQDSFLRSNQSGCSETIYSSPFLSGQFKLHVCVADETLNISVLKVIDPTSESNSAHEAVSMISEKGIQTSNNVFHVNSPTVLPSSNSSSQPDNPNSNPFPFLSGTSNPVNSQPFLVLAKETAVDIAEPPLKEINDMGAPKRLCNANEKIFACENAAVKDLDMSEVIHFPESSFHQDNSISMKLQKDPDSFVQIDESTNLRNKKDVCSSPCKNDSEATTVPLFLEADNSEVMVLPIKKADKKNIPKADDASSFKDSSLQPMNKSPKVVTIDSEDLSDFDKDNHLKLLHQCASKETGTKKKQSRLSLKKKSRFRRTQIYDSSDESDGENCEMSKIIPQEIELCVSSVADKPLGDILSDAKTIHTSKSAENIKNTAVLEMPSTLNSIFSEDAPEGNASEIILEIEDLSDKIKSLEEKLRQCGHSDLPKSQGHSLKHLSHNTSKRLSGNSSMIHRSDSEDSNDLFPQSVPPTPERCVNEANPSFKSSFYT